MPAPIPNLPTDNLYKFIALFGLSIVVVTFIFGMLNELEDKKEHIQLNYVIDSNNKLIDVRNSLVRKNKEVADIYEKLKMNNELTNDTCKFLYSSVVSFNLQVDSLDKIIDGDSVKVKMDKHSMEYEYQERIGIMTIVGIIIGFTITFFGFIFWYKNSQFYQDLLLEKEVGVTYTNIQDEFKKRSKKLLMWLALVMLLMCIGSWIIAYY